MAEAERKKIEEEKALLHKEYQLTVEKIARCALLPAYAHATSCPVPGTRMTYRATACLCAAMRRYARVMRVSRSGAGSGT